MTPGRSAHRLEEEAVAKLDVPVSSSNFRCFDRNSGNGVPAATATEADFVVAE